jgi:hypothetical protein
MEIDPMQMRTLFSAAALFVLLSAVLLVAAEAEPPAATTEAAAGARPAVKQVLLPKRITRVPRDNDFDDPESEFCHARSKSTDNFVLFWAKEYGLDPGANQDERRRFDVDRCLSECERFFDYYVNTLKWLDMDSSVAARYKFLIFVFGGSSGTAFGGAIDDKIGALWTPAVRIHREPYGVLAHELGHSFQALQRADGGGGFSGGAIYEMTAQYMLWQVYPEWMTFENYHLVDFMRQTHLAFLHQDNMYHSCYPLEYWSDKHGLEFIARLWREAQREEDPVLAYRRITGINQQQFNAEMFDACRRFVTWDLPRIEKVAARYANQHETKIIAEEDGWYRIAPEKCPQNYGYNAIQLETPSAGTTVQLQFEGLAGAEGYSSVQPEKAGWRYGFVASRDDGSREYGEMYSDSNATGHFTVPENTKHLWLVVMGAPTEHWVRQGGSRRRREAGAADEQWPYRFHLEGTTPVESVIQ